jgi:hypothetical protein
VLVHLATVAGVVACLRLGWWQIDRALDGNLLSFGYAIQWPAFAAFAIFVWIKEARRAVRASRDPEARIPAPAERARTPHVGPAYDDSGDEQLAAYNRYLAWLNANPSASPRDYPG